MTDHPAPDAAAQLLEIEAIKQLKARYFRLIDTKQWTEWGQVFGTDVCMEVPEVDMIINGRDAVVEFVSTSLAGTRTVHHGHTPEIALTGPDTARGIWAMEDHVEWTGPDGETAASLVGYGHYHEEYVREDGRWRIGRSRLERLRVDLTS